MKGHNYGPAVCRKCGKVHIPPMLGKHHSEEFREQRRKTSIGYRHSEAAIEKMRAAKLGDQNPAKRPEVREKISKAAKEIWEDSDYQEKQHTSHMGNVAYNKGIVGVVKASEETRKKMRAAHRGKVCPWNSYPHPDEHREKNRIAHIGKNNANWRGGSSFESYPESWKEHLREAIRQRDGCICRVCNSEQEQLGKKLDVHHIDYNKENVDRENLVSLCHSCHSKTNYNRQFWIVFFQERASDG